MNNANLATDSYGIYIFKNLKFKHVFLEPVKIALEIMSLKQLKIRNKSTKLHKTTGQLRTQINLENGRKGSATRNIGTNPYI